MCASCTNTEGLISRLNETRENRRMNASPLFPTKLRAARMWGYRRLVASGKSVFLSVWDELVKLQQNRWQGQMLRMVLKVRQMTRDWGQRAVLEFWRETEELWKSPHEPRVLVAIAAEEVERWLVWTQRCCRPEVETRARFELRRHSRWQCENGDTSFQILTHTHSMQQEITWKSSENRPHWSKNTTASCEHLALCFQCSHTISDCPLCACYNVGGVRCTFKAACVSALLWPWESCYSLGDKMVCWFSPAVNTAVHVKRSRLHPHWSWCSQFENSHQKCSWSLEELICSQSYLTETENIWIWTWQKARWPQSFVNSCRS